MGTNLLALVMYVCQSLVGLTKLNTTAYHPQLRWHGGTHKPNTQVNDAEACCDIGSQWDQYPCVAFYGRTGIHHASTKEKPSFLLYGVDCRSPIEAALLPNDQLEPNEISDYWEELILSL